MATKKQAMQTYYVAFGRQAGVGPAQAYVSQVSADDAAGDLRNYEDIEAEIILEVNVPVKEVATSKLPTFTVTLEK
jgi:hypothetical protein